MRGDALRTEAAHFSHYTRVLVVGISDYKDTGFPNLPCASSQGRALVQALAEPEGCGIPTANISFIGNEATAELIAAGLESIAAKCDPRDYLVFYFAGHGSTRNQSFALHMGQAEIGGLISSTKIEAILADVRARGVLVVIDCCGGAAIAESAPAFFRRLDLSEFRILISASKSGQSSWEFPEPLGSAFTHQLIRILRGDDPSVPKGEMYFTDLFAAIHAFVVEQSKRHFGIEQTQEPVFSGSFSHDPLLFLHRKQTLVSGVG